MSCHRLGPVGRAVVGQDPFDGDAAVGEPGHGAAQDARWRSRRSRRRGSRRRRPGSGRRSRCARTRAHQRVAVTCCAACRAVAARFVSPWLAADEAPAAAVGDVAELLDIDVDQRPGMVVLVAADRFTGGPVDMGQPVEPAPDQDLVHRRGGDPGTGRRAGPGRGACATAARTPAAPPAPASGPAAGAGRLDRSAIGSPGGIPVGPPLHRRPRHLEPGGDLADRPALVDDQLGDLQPGRGVSAALAWDTEDLLFVERTFEQFHSTAGGPPRAHQSDRVVTTDSTNLSGQYS